MTVAPQSTAILRGASGEVIEAFLSGVATQRSGYSSLLKQVAESPVGLRAKLLADRAPQLRKSAETLLLHSIRDMGAEE